MRQYRKGRVPYVTQSFSVAAWLPHTCNLFNPSTVRHHRKPLRATSRQVCIIYSGDVYARVMPRLELTASVYREQIDAIIGVAKWIAAADRTSMGNCCNFPRELLEFLRVLRSLLLLCGDINGYSVPSL